MISVDTILVNEQDLAKLDDLCRLCGKLDETCIPIFDENNRYNYFKVINLHFKDAFEVSKSDALPLKLCAKCLASMLSWHEFYYNCVDVEKKFRQLAEKFNLDTTKKSVGNDVEVIEVSVDGESYDFFNENTSDFDISNVNIKETSTFADTSDLSPFDDDSDNSSVKTEKLTEKLPDHSESVTESEAPKIKKDNSKSFTPGKRTTSVRGSAGTATKRSKSCATAVTAASGVSNPIKSEETTSNKPKANVLTITNQANKVKISSIKEVPSMMDQKPTNVPMDVLADIASGSEIKEEKINIEDDGDEIVQLECEVRLDLDMESDANELDVKDDVAESDANVAATSDDTKPKKKSSYRNPKMCDICGKVVNSKLFKEHMIGHSDPESMTCSCCGKLFSTISTLKKHFIWTHTSLRPFMCDLCGNTFKRNDHLKLHRDHFHANETSGGTALKCGLCGTSVQTMVSLLNHMKRVHNQTKVTSFDKDLNHKILADKSYECGICNMNFKQFSYLRIHIKFVHEKGLPWHINQGANGPYKCKPCNTSYATLQSLREHNRRRHDNAPVEKFHKECSHCGMLYRNRVHYSKHLAKISGRPTCYVCWNDFDNAEELKVHINTDHLDELPFGCELCGVRFVYLTELRNHMYTHSKTKQFKCDMCSQSFVRKDFLKSHMRRHLGIRNHTCEECSKSFVEFCDLRKHMQIHLKNRLFSAANR